MYTYNATIVSVHDGDTFTADIDLGFGLWKRGCKLRLLGCNSIELKDPGGAEAQANLLKWLPIGSTQIVETYKPYKYGDEWMADVDTSVGGSLVKILALQYWVAKWDGRGKAPVPPWPRPIS